jgi:hypothetical protein
MRAAAMTWVLNIAGTTFVKLNWRKEEWAVLIDPTSATAARLMDAVTMTAMALRNHAISAAIFKQQAVSAAASQAIHSGQTVAAASVIQIASVAAPTTGAV